MNLLARLFSHFAPENPTPQPSVSPHGAPNVNLRPFGAVQMSDAAAIAQ